MINNLPKKIRKNKLIQWHIKNMVFLFNKYDFFTELYRNKYSFDIKIIPNNEILDLIEFLKLHNIKFYQNNTLYITYKLIKFQEHHQLIKDLSKPLITSFLDFDIPELNNKIIFLKRINSFQQYKIELKPDVQI